MKFILKLDDKIERMKKYFQKKVSLRNDTYNLLIAFIYLILLWIASTFMNAVVTNLGNSIVIIGFPIFLLLVWKSYIEK